MAQLKDLLVIGSTHFVGDVYFSKIPKYNNNELAVNKDITISGVNGVTVSNGNINLNDGDVGVTISHADTSTQQSVTANGRTYITGVGLDDYGHVTGLTTGTEDDSALNDYKKKQTPVSSPTTATGQKAIAFIDTISQTADGVITATKKEVDFSKYVTEDSFVAAMKFKGALGTSGTETGLPASPSNGDMYKVITGGTYKYSSNKKSITVKVGDAVIWNATASEWVIIPSGDEPSGTVTSVATSGGLTGGTITTSGTISIADEGVTTEKIADKAITGAKIDDATITGEKIDASTITLQNLSGNIYDSKGNRKSEILVMSSADGQIDSEKYAITDGANKKATMQYDDTTKAVKFVFAT